MLSLTRHALTDKVEIALNILNFSLNCAPIPIHFLICQWGQFTYFKWLSSHLSKELF